MSKKLQDSMALLDNILDGTALPEHLSKPRSEGIDRKALVREIDEKLARSPLVAVCYDHKCRCNATWKSFGFYARKCRISVPGQGDAYPTKALEYFPHNEVVVETIWQTVQEQACVKCFDRATLLVAREAANG